MRRHTVRCAVLVVVAAAAVAADLPEVTVVDTTGQSVTLELPVERIVTAYAMATYYAYALGAGDHLLRAWYIGVRTLDAAPEALRRLDPELGTKHAAGAPNLEEIAALAPDWILVDAVRHAAFAELAEEIGLRVTRLAVESPDALVDALRLVAPPLGEEAERRAESLAAEYLTAVAAVRAAIEEEDDLPRVLFLGSSPQLVATGEMYQTHLIDAAGGRAVARALSGYWAEVSLEQIYAWDPEVIILPSYASFSAEDLLQDPEWAALSAVRERRVHRMERLFAPWDTPVPDSFLGILWLAERLHPGRVPIDLRDEVLRFYAAHYAYHVTEAELDRLCAP
ncbi:MAG: ABC transporter substrate-binding protein [Candidatus Bipolaricaulota bacterium]|nr:MAG: ABC transporter substrate-binding protein [Candidatus Bipolaricaulota bacterium]